ncbi:histone-lysine N-methyltransferase SETMAR [Trichonephila clavipes]|nr:histone-lysine N-methyltransferase SETMAR [Trichonephila clavipes]
MEVTRVEPRADIKTAVLRGRNVMECHSELVETIGKNALLYRTVAPWVGKFQQGRVSTSDEQRSGRLNGDQFLSRIIAIDEFWASAYEPELKRQSAEWQQGGLSRRQKNLSPVKLMVIVAYDVRDVIVCHFVSHGRELTAQYYRDFLVRQEPIRGRRFATRENIANAVRQQMARFTKGVANAEADGIQRLPDC